MSSRPWEVAKNPAQWRLIKAYMGDFSDGKEPQPHADLAKDLTTEELEQSRRIAYQTIVIISEVFEDILPRLYRTGEPPYFFYDGETE